MRQIPVFYTFIMFLLILIGLFGCGNRKKHPELRVFGAISLTDALTDIGDQFTANHDTKMDYNFAASSTLQRQLEKGASADVFISASPRQIDALETLDLIETDSRHDLLTNRLVLVADKTSDFSLETVDSLADVSRIAVGDPEIVPAGAYAKAALQHLGLWEKVQPKLVFGTDVRATLAYVSTGNVDVAIVYQTDVALSKNAKVLYEFPAEMHSPIVYPAVVLKDSPQKQFAQQFIAYLKTPRAVEIFEKHGFTCLLFDSVQ